jgi:hypothetical protein
MMAVLVVAAVAALVMALPLAILATRLRNTMSKRTRSAFRLRTMALRRRTALGTSPPRSVLCNLRLQLLLLRRRQDCLHLLTELLGQRLNGLLHLGLLCIRKLHGCSGRPENFRAFLAGVLGRVDGRVPFPLRRVVAQDGPRVWSRPGIH